MGLLTIILLLIPLAMVLGVAYLVLTILNAQKYWEKKKIFTVTKPKVFLLGQIGNVILRKQSFALTVQDMYKDVRENNLDYGGMYQFQRPSLVITNPELIGEITIKQFEHFLNRRPLVDQSVDRLFGRSLLGLQNEEWREMRHHLSPAFTGAKLRGMMGLIESTCTKFGEFLNKRPDPNEPLDIYESFRRLAADLIATTAFGSPSDSISNPDAEFFKNGIKIMDFSGRRALIMMGYLISPQMMKVLNLPFLPPTLRDFFTNKIIGTIEYREKENKSRADMIQLLMDARKGDSAKDIPNGDIASQAFTFFLGGFDTMATAFSFTCHCLAMHPEIQNKVRDEIQQVMEQNDGKMSYDSLKDLKYMDMVIAEVLRIHPPAVMLDRQCSKNISFPKFNLTLEKGSSIIIPVYGLHFDPEYFPEPEKFDPERFSEENKKKIKPFTYLPFGEGPRNCIGKRFAMLELKLGLSLILSKHELEVCKKTNVSVPMQYNKTTTLMQPEGGFWLNIKPLSEE